MCDGVTDWPPHIDKPNSRLEEAGSLFYEVAVDSSHTGIKCLINVDAFLGSTLSLVPRDEIGIWLTTGPRIG